MSRTIYGLGLAGLTLLSLAVSPAVAQNFKADLKTSEEAPPVTGNASGKLEATYDAASKKLSWKGTYSGLTGPATAAHFHGPADPGKNAGVAVAAPAPSSPFEGSATLTDAQAADLAAGKLYFNIHTAANPGGELRGQVLKGN
jgi:hypothetical protein